MDCFARVFFPHLWLFHIVGAHINMANFSPEALYIKLSKLINTQESIETLSHWILFHHKHVRTTVKICQDYIMNEGPKQKLLTLFLINDVVQKNKRKDKNDFIEGFSGVLPSLLSHVYNRSDEDIRKQILRLVHIWEERCIFEKNDIEIMKNTLSNIQATQQKPSDETSSPKVPLSIPLISNVSFHSLEKLKSLKDPSALKSIDPNQLFDILFEAINTTSQNSLYGQLESFIPILKGDIFTKMNQINESRHSLSSENDLARLNEWKILLIQLKDSHQTFLTTLLEVIQGEELELSNISQLLQIIDEKISLSKNFV